MSPGAVTAADCEGSNAPPMGTLTTAVTPKPENTDGAWTLPQGTSSEPVELSASPVA